MRNPSSDAPNDDAAGPVIDSPAVEPAHPEEIPAGEPSSPKKPGGLFNPQTRFGRFMRGLTRVLAVIVGLFALGVLAAYLLLYRPMADQAAGLKAELAQARQQLSQQQHDLDAAKQDLAGLKATNQALAHSLDQAKTLQALLAARAMVNQARFHLAAGDVPTARTEMADVSTRLKALPASSSVQAQDLQARLDLAVRELEREPKTAASDLAILADQLETLERAIPAQ